MRDVFSILGFKGDFLTKFGKVLKIIRPTHLFFKSRSSKNKSRAGGVLLTPRYCKDLRGLDLVESPWPVNVYFQDGILFNAVEEEATYDFITIGKIWKRKSGIFGLSYTGKLYQNIDDSNDDDSNPNDDEVDDKKM